MRTAGRENVYVTHGRDNQASLTVAPGETFAVECRAKVTLYVDITDHSYICKMPKRYLP